MRTVRAETTGVAFTYYTSDYWVPDERVSWLISEAVNELGAGSDRNAGVTVYDFGGGVGQYCHALVASTPSVRCAAFDNAGNVEAVSDGFTTWFDVGQPLWLPRASWVISLEMAEHVPNQFEPMLVRNLHASNCRGLILSWGSIGGHGGGHGDANLHSKKYLIALFESLGYKHRLNMSRAALMRPTSPAARHAWFDDDLVGVFERRTVPLGC